MRKNKLPRNPIPNSPQVLIPKRRLPRPTTRPHPLTQRLSGIPPVIDNPAALEIAERIKRLCIISKLDPYIVLSDFFAMCKWHLRLYGINLKSFIIEGKAAEDPPDAKLFFNRARERFDQATLRQPGTFRAMIDAYTGLYQGLREPRPLEDAAANPTVNPDLIAQVFVACLRPGPEWWPYVPPWPVAQRLAEQLLPDPIDMIEEALTDAGIAYRVATGYPPPETMRAKNWGEWFSLIYPYLGTLLIGPNFINSSTMLLALAARFPAWIRQGHLIHFHMNDDVPIIHTMFEITAMLQGLNGFALTTMETMFEIGALLEEREGQIRVNPLPHPQPAEPAQEEDDLHSIIPQSALSMPTFETLFRSYWKEEEPHGKKE
ncbi:MAG: hypothetical protein BroJett011_42920 [Chloroflexota bacterium]|nr:MAG: hypothetical protein BroJett011_42920 [Chloroflexota bacterium]